MSLETVVGNLVIGGGEEWNRQHGDESDDGVEKPHRWKTMVLS